MYYIALIFLLVANTYDTTSSVVQVYIDALIAGSVTDPKGRSYGF